MDENVVERIVEDWRVATPPMRPSATRVEVFRSALGAAESVLVMGATPELIDMLLDASIARIAAVDLHAETIEAMRRLAARDWSPVELVAADWRDERAAWREAFDAALCHGGLNFLPFPEEWRTALAVIRGYLRPGGRLISSSFSVSPATTGFRDDYERAIARYESAEPGPRGAAPSRAFMEMVSGLKGVTLFGAVEADGMVRLDVTATASRWIAQDLRRRYPGSAHHRIVDAIFGRSNPVGVDGAALTAVPGRAAVEAEMVCCGFEIELVASDEHPPRHSFTLAATRPRRPARS